MKNNKWQDRYKDYDNYIGNPLITHNQIMMALILIF